MQFFFKISLLLLCLWAVAGRANAQLTVTGTVFDSSKRNYLKDVRVESSTGIYTLTDSMGRYKLPVTEKDSLIFIYNNKATQKFIVAKIPNLMQFDVSLHVNVKDGIKTLKEVVVYTKSYQQDSLENREVYARFYDFQKPTLRSSISPGGVAGADVNELINMFRFKRNKQLKAFQARLELQEQDRYVSYRFNKKFVGRITQLKGAELDTFMIRYLPSYEFASMADEVTFNRYVLNSSYAFKIEMLNSGRPLSPAEIKQKRDLWKKIN